jgi:DNA-binding transcriptional LysR family regulator
MRVAEMKDSDIEYEQASFGVRTPPAKRNSKALAGPAMDGKKRVPIGEEGTIRKSGDMPTRRSDRSRNVSSGLKVSHLPRIDLNLLFVFEAMMQERSVTRAAQRLCVSQSSVSHALNRLRATLKDELFIRGTGEMRPTPRAIALAVSVTPTLMHIRAALSPAEFDPATAVHTFQIAMTDYAATLLLEKLAKAVRSKAPDVNLKINLNVMKDVWSLLDKQEVDLMVGMVPTPPDRFASELLYEDGIAVVMSRDNPLGKRKLALEAYAAAKHVYIPVDGVMPVHTGRIDRALELKGLVRRHVLTVGQFALAPPIVQQSDYIMTIPKRVADMCRARYRLKAMECPVKLPLQPTRIIWHPQLGNHSANRWMIRTLREVAAKF